MDKMLSERTSKIDASGIRKVFSLAAQLRDPINFSIGQPDFDVPEPLKEAAIRAIREGANKYSQTAGDRVLLDRAVTQVQRQFGWRNPAVLISSGVSGALLLAFLSLVDPGDEVIIPDPYFVIYKHLVNMLGGQCVFVDSYPTFELPVRKIAAAVTDRTKIIILNSPANPTGAVYGVEELKQVANIAAQRGIVVITDEIYDQFCYDGPCASIASCYDRVLVLRGFSKSFAMTGWRLGYVAAPGSMRPVVEEMIKIQQYTFVCAPTPLQKAALAAMDYDMSEWVAAYLRKRDLLYDGLRETFDLVKPGGAFYAFVRAPGGQATPFVEEAIRNNVLVIPGNVFSQQDTHFRISYATSDEKIRQGVEVLCSLA